MEVFADVILPPRVIRAGIGGKNRRNNTRTTNQAGYEHVNVNWSRTLREYQLGIVDRDVEAWSAIEALHEITEGGAFGFLMQDPKDYNVSTRQGLIATFGGPAGQLVKVYTVAGSTRTKRRTITRVKTATLYRDGVELAGATVDPTTGVVTFVPDAVSSITTYTTGASTVVQLPAPLGFLVGDGLYIASATGSIAAALNDRLHVITGVAGSAYTIATDTTGLTWGVTGQARRYPQPRQALGWLGEFYVPVHFTSDDIDWSLTRPGPDAETRLVSGDSVTVMEVRE